MPNIEVRGKYRTFRYDGDAPLDFTPYNNSIFLIRRPNPTTFVTLQQYVPGQGGVFTTFQPGSSYTIVTNADGSQDFNFDMGPYTRVNRLPSSTIIQSPNFYIGLDKNSIVVPISSYALSVNKPLSSVVNILYINGQGNRLQYLAADSFRTGAPVNFTHFLPNSGYELRTRLPFTFFAPLQSEMGDAFAVGNNDGGEFGMGHRYSLFREGSLSLDGPSVIADQTFGIWDKIVTNGTQQTISWNGQTFASASQAALSSCGASKALFVLGSNLSGQLGTGSSQQYYPTWTRVPGQWKDVDIGSEHMLAINSSGHLYSTGSNARGQLGLGSGVVSVNTLTLVDNRPIWVELAPDGQSTVVRDSLGRIWGCGRNDSGQLGLNNTTSSVYTLTQEATNSTWKKVRGGGNSGFMVALKENKLFGTGTSSYYFGSGTTASQKIFTQEILGLTDIEDFYRSYRGTYIKRIGQDKLFASGYEGSARYSYLATSPFSAAEQPGGFNPGVLLYFTKTAIPSNITKIISNNTSGTFGYISNNRFYVRVTSTIAPKTFTIFSAFNAYDVYPEIGGFFSTFFIMKDGIRPTPTPTLTPTPTPTLTPSPTPPPWPSPVNVLQVAIFGGTYPGYGSQFPTSNQYYAYNSPGNLNSNFTFNFNEPNGGYVPPGAIASSTFDYEKGNFNNIVGIGINVYTGTGQSPAGRYNPRYIYKKIGTRWEYTLLPANLDANTIRPEYTPADGCDTLLITPQHPQYSSTSQGVYNLIFVRNKRWCEAISYDRGSTWDTSSIETIDNYYSGTGTNKMIYSRSRGVNYKVCVVGCRSNTTQLIFAQRFPDFNSPEIIFNNYTLGLGYIQGFDFKHDYYDIPTVVFSLIQSGAIGAIALIRKINGSWQTVIVKQGIVNLCSPGQTYSTISRRNSPNISLELDPTNNNLIYIAYLRYGSNLFVAGYINVLCYNLATNSIVFDETVVRATGAQGITEPALHSVDSSMADVPILFYDKTNSSLNLFFVGYNQLSNPRNKNLMMSRINGSWTAPANNFTTTGTFGPNMSNNRQLSVKY